MENVPPPLTCVVSDGALFRCELVVYVSKGGQVKDVRLRGPPRGSRSEALRDCVALRAAAVEGGADSSLALVREKRQKLEEVTWEAEDLVDDVLAGAEGPAPQKQWQQHQQKQSGTRVAQHHAAGVDLEQRVNVMKQEHALDDAAAVKLLSVFKERARLGCDVVKDLAEFDTHLAASNKPSALVSMKLADLSSGRPIGPCRFAGGRKDAGVAKKLAGSVKIMEDPKIEPKFKPIGPNWRKPGALCRLPADEGEWLVHERQDAGGKYRAWLFFDGDTGKYFQERESGDGYIGVGVPHDPKDHSLLVKASSASVHSGAGKKLDMAVLLPELHKTGAVLKQPLEFLDRPAALFVLCDGLRDTAAATEFCVKKFHSLLLPRLSSRATEWEDFELADILSEATEALDSMLLDSAGRLAGCSLAVALLVGSRLVVGALGGTRVLLCAPPPATPAASSGGRAQAAGTQPWTARLLAGGDVHSAACAAERMRVASAGGRLLGETGGPAALLHPRSSNTGAGEPGVPGDEQEREMLRVSRATNPFAALGLSTSDLHEGAPAVRRIFRKRSLVVHPDKVAEALKTRAVAAFAKLEAASTAVEAMLHEDAAATALIADVFAAHDDSCLIAEPAAAARLLDVPEGCGIGAVQEAKRQKLGPLSRLQEVCPREVKQALAILESAQESLLRGTALWTPAEPAAAVAVTRALGCADLKTPVPLLAVGLATEVVQVDQGAGCALVLLADGARGLSDNDVAQRVRQHRGRPRAAALQLAVDAGAAGGSDEAVGAVCAYFQGLATTSGAGSVGSLGPAAKKARTATSGGKNSLDRVRVSHVLLRWAGLRGADTEERRGFPAPKRSQAEAERELLNLLAELSAGDTKTLGTRFKSVVQKRSECPSAQNVPYADLGWIERGSTDATLEAAAFDTPVGELSDIVVTARGAHLLYRLA
eukprot:TRINITY_DN18097_c0_g1_i2.p1 TRINITY_DN18097_c0_g1~~TRINITY_DN18097_c0_g1_i2.p1  ORF type:complete len:964 (-),score=209.68 TRINITY_DN18097_c0_g1_i2:96-2903(-)